MRAIRCLLAALLAAGIVTVVAAQPGEPRRTGGPQLDPYILVLTNPALQEEVKATAAQKEKFAGIAEKHGELINKAREGLKGVLKDTQGDEEKFQKGMATVRKSNAKVHDEIRKLVDPELTADQKKRLNQIAVQLLGANAFADPDANEDRILGAFGYGTLASQKALQREVQSALKLTDQQKSSIKDLMGKYDKGELDLRLEFLSAKEGRSIEKDALRERMAEYRKESSKLSKQTVAKIEELFNDSQKKTWKELTGEKVDVSELRPVRPKGKWKLKD